MMAVRDYLLGGIGGYRSCRDLGSYHERCSHLAGTAKESKGYVSREGKGTLIKLSLM